MSDARRDFDAAAAGWDENPGRVKVGEDVARAIRETVKLSPEMDVLDFGCGTGLLTLRLQPSVRTITGVDSSQGMLGVLAAKVRAQGLANVKVVHADLEKGEMPEGTFDLVVSSMTLHHIPDTGAMLKRLAGLTKPGGQIAIADLDCDEGKFHDSGEGVFHNGFDRCVMQKQLEAAGFGSIRNRTAAYIAKPGPDGTRRSFSVFLMTGKKRP